MVLYLVVVVAAAFPLPPVVEPAAWVEPVEVPKGPVAPDGATRELLIDTQVRVEKTVEHFEHRAWKVLSHAGVEQLARRQFHWDPSWETFQLHGVWIWRGGQRRVAWHPEDARVIQRESDLDEGLYDGRLTLIVELRDLREGDVVELASTTVGENPVYQGHFATRFFQSWAEDIEQSRFRLTWQRQRPLRFKGHGGAVAPTVVEEGRAQVYRWDLRHLKGARFEAAMPADVEPAPWVEFSDWRDWEEVARWADGLFSVAPTGRHFEDELARFRAMPEAARAPAIVRFVQDDVRYVGVEIGEHSHQPHSPAWVLERGFGDCKDKSLLLVSLLRAAGMDASPALVHSRAGQQLPQLLPSSNVFDHAIVQVLLPSGPRFIDPTLTLRRGPLEAMPQPSYHQALVVKPGAIGLTPMPVDSNTEPTWEVEQRWKLPAPSGKASLTIITTARAMEASSLRQRVKRNTHEELTRDLLKEREEALDAKLTSLALRWSDDEGTEQFVLTEEYETAEFFADGKHEFQALVVPRDLKYLSEPQRSWPFALWHPLRVREVILYEAPEVLRASEYDVGDHVFSHPAFELAVAQSLSGHTLKLEWDLRTLKDRVLPSEVESYRTARQRAREYFAYEVSSVAKRYSSDSQRNSDPTSGLLLLGGLVAVGLGIAGASRASTAWTRWRGQQRTREFKAKQQGAPGELAANPAVVPTLLAGAKLFTSARCPDGHGWGEIAAVDTARLGDERMTVLARTCAGGEARESRYVKLPSNAA